MHTHTRARPRTYTHTRTHTHTNTHAYNTHKQTHAHTYAHSLHCLLPFCGPEALISSTAYASHAGCHVLEELYLPLLKMLWGQGASPQTYLTKIVRHPSSPAHLQSHSSAVKQMTCLHEPQSPIYRRGCGAPVSDDQTAPAILLPALHNTLCLFCVILLITRGP
jgi:hypothetical protein